MDTKALTALMNTAEDQGLLVFPQWDPDFPDVMIRLVINDVILENEDHEYELACALEALDQWWQDSREINRGRFE